MPPGQISAEWPELRFEDWESTCDTVHMWAQIVGKTRMVLSPRQNHWWHAALYVTPQGLTTSAIPFGGRTFEVEFNFISHKLAIRTSEGQGSDIRLYPRSVADFYAEYMAALRQLGIDVTIGLKPAEFDDATPFDQDRHHASYDEEYIERFRRILVGADTALKQFRSGYIGKCSPVHFFWGSFDLAVTRFNGKLAALPEKPDPITAEAYSHAVISCGFWPGNRSYKHAAFYAYAVPAPAGLADQPIRPPGASWDKELSEFILRYDIVRQQPSPEQSVREFCQSTYEVAANLAQWDRPMLERR